MEVKTYLKFLQRETFRTALRIPRGTIGRRSAIAAAWAYRLAAR